jgi:acyl-coenzyme A thioesterase PaaI-like protein
MKKEIPNPFANNDCFFCGRDNQLGLKLKFYWDEEGKETSTEYMPQRHFSGQGSILHGAIQMGLLDEIMGWTSFLHTQEKAVTSNLKVKFLKPVYINGKTLKVTCRLTAKEGPKVHMEATLANSEGIPCTTATGTYHVLPAVKYEALIHGE